MFEGPREFVIEADHHIDLLAAREDMELTAKRFMDPERVVWHVISQYVLLSLATCR